MLCGNDDAHLKNWSLVYPDRRNGVLSPAYDLVCTAVYFDRPQDMALKLSGKEISADICLDDFRRIADMCRVERGVIEEAVRSMIAAYGEALDKVEVPTRLTSINVRGRSIDCVPGSVSAINTCRCLYCPSVVGRGVLGNRARLVRGVGDEAGGGLSLRRAGVRVLRG